MVLQWIAKIGHKSVTLSRFLLVKFWNTKIFILLLLTIIIKSPVWFSDNAGLSFFNIF